MVDESGSLCPRCLLCAYKAANDADLDLHCTQLHASPAGLRCNVTNCAALLPTKRDLNTHKVVHHGHKRCGYQKCLKVFKYAKRRELHRFEAHGIGVQKEKRGEAGHSTHGSKDLLDEMEIATREYLENVQNWTVNQDEDREQPDASFCSDDIQDGFPLLSLIIHAVDVVSRRKVLSEHVVIPLQPETAFLNSLIETPTSVVEKPKRKRSSQGAKCEECEQVFPNKLRLGTHIKEVHTPKPEQPTPTCLPDLPVPKEPEEPSANGQVRCAYLDCSEWFQSAEGMLSHIRALHDPFRE